MTGAPTKPPPRPLFADVDPSTISDITERLFVETCLDVERRVIDGRPYEILRASGLLRQLILDQTPLCHVVNRKHRQRLQFEVLDPDQYPPIALETHWRNLDPEPFPGGAVIRVPLDGLLRARIVYHDGTPATVRDVIKTCANAKGGVHLGPPASDAERVVLELDLLCRGESGELSEQALAALCRVVLRGLAPLVRAVLAAA